MHSCSDVFMVQMENNIFYLQATHHLVGYFIGFVRGIMSASLIDSYNRLMLPKMLRQKRYLFFHNIIDFIFRVFHHHW